MNELENRHQGKVHGQCITAQQLLGPTRVDNPSSENKKTPHRCEVNLENMENKIL